MSNCIFCGAHTVTYIWVPERNSYEPVCETCRTKREHERIEEGLSRVKSASDFKTWKKADMSEAFWMHLIEYQKRPNRHSLEVMRTALLWAHHDDHGLSNSFSNALDWCGIDLYGEETYKEMPER